MIGLVLVAAVAAGAAARRRALPRRIIALRHGSLPPPPARRHTPTDDEWAGLLDSVAAEVRGGISLQSALAAAAGRAGLRGVAVQPDTPLSVVPSLTSPDPAEAVVLQTITLAAALGGNTASTLESGAALLRERAAVRADAVAHSAQARLSARVLTAVPLVFAAWSMAASRSFRAAVGSPVGVVCAVAGVACNLVGWWWMRRIVTSAWR